MGKIIAVANQKGGVGKTTTCVNLGIGLVREGKRVLLVEADAQGSMAVSLGIQEPDELDVTLVNLMEKIINDEDVEPGEGILHHEEGVDFIPANIELAGLETSLVNVMSREQVMRLYLDGIRDSYDYILIDCMPSLGMITINALVAADHVLIPVEAAYLPVKGLAVKRRADSGIFRGDMEAVPKVGRYPDRDYAEHQRSFGKPGN